MTAQAFHHERTAPTFDWRTIVAQSVPGEGSPDQRARLVALRALTAELYGWAQQHQLPPRRVESSAYTGIVVTTTPTPARLAYLMAQYTLWLFVFDGYVDTLPYETLDDTTPAGKGAYLDRRLAPIIRPLYTVGGLTDDKGRSYGLPPYEQATPDPAAPADHDDWQLSYRLGTALEDLYAGLASAWRQEAHGAAEFCLRTFVHETAAVLGVMRGELLQSFSYQATAAQPQLEDYLDRSKISICLRAAASVALGFEAQPAQVWQPWADAMDPSMKALRIANDLANIDKERDEQKVNSVTIMLEQLGGLPAETYGGQHPDVQRAKMLLQERIEAEMAVFAHQIADLPEGPLAYYVRNCSAFTIAMYEHGDYIEPV